MLLRSNFESNRVPAAGMYPQEIASSLPRTPHRSPARRLCHGWLWHDDRPAPWQVGDSRP